MKIEDLKKFGINGSNKGKLIIDFSSEWCGPCKVLTPILENFKEKGLIDLIKIDIYKNPELTKELNIQAVPTLFFFKDGQLLDKDLKVNRHNLVNKGIMVGSYGELILEELIKQI